MKTINLWLLTIILLTSITTLATTAIADKAPDAKHGEKVYSTKCGGCHDTRIHTRPNRIVHTYEDLVNRVRFCDSAAKANFKESDIYDVSEYLNNTFYKFLKVDS